MFKKNKRRPAPNNTQANSTPAERAEVSTLVGRATTLEGDVRFSGVLKVDGTILGNLVAESNDSVLILDEEGKVEGEIRVPSMIINGVIKGNVFASEKIDLYPKAQITGDVHYNLLEMEVGAEVNGRMLRQEGQAFEASNVASINKAGSIEAGTAEDSVDSKEAS